jgi:hypothetical protein
MGILSERTRTGNAAAIRQISSTDDIVDSKVSADVPLSWLHIVWLTLSDMLENTVVELVNQDTLSLGISELLEELWIIEHLELGSLRVNPDTGSRNSLAGPFVHLTGQLSEERLIAEQAGHMHI